MSDTGPVTWTGGKKEKRILFFLFQKKKNKNKKEREWKHEMEPNKKEEKADGIKRKKTRE